jgi:uncharacterized membrane protein
MQPYDIFAFVFLIVFYLGYRIFYIYALNDPKWDVRENLIDEFRRKWVDTIAKDKNGILAIQTLRNLEMANTFLISLTMLIMGGIASVFSANMNWITLLESNQYLAFLNEHPVAMKLMVSLALIMEAFFNFIFSLRIQVNMNFTISMANDSGQYLEFLHNQAHRQARHFILGLRALFFAVAPLVWIINTTVMIALLLFIIVSLYRFDFASRVRPV